MERIDPMKYLPGMEVLENSDIEEQVVRAMEEYDYNRYTADEVKRALAADYPTPEDFGALLSPAAEPFLEAMARRARAETRKHFGNSVLLFTPLYISNYCENHCVYCGFNRTNKIRRAKLGEDGIRAEMEAIAKTGMEEVLILTGESRTMSGVEYIGRACEIARSYLKYVGIEVYPM
ncbi:MAG: hypothetical protein J6S75_10525, partial [Thermoguttaceae bacterium]|nr:hypothetical protein [Thermoguttaceae bacterium]